MQTITVNNITAEVEWKKIKNIHLTVYPPDARVHISAPLTMEEESVRLFVISKFSWIKQRVGQVKEQERQTRREYVSGENYYYKGLRYRLKVVFQEAVPKVELRGNRYIVLYVRTGCPVDKRAEILKEWYRKELKELLPPLIQKWENILDVKVNHWEVKQMKTLWGSCNHTTRNIIFNLELIKKPMHGIEYIVAHELLHINIRLHNELFTATLDNHLPTWRNIKNELNEFII